MLLGQLGQSRAGACAGAEGVMRVARQRFPHNDRENAERKLVPAFPLPIGGEGSAVGCLRGVLVLP